MKKRFTALEIITLLLGIVALIIFIRPTVSNSFVNKKPGIAKSDVLQIAFAVVAYKADYQQFPFNRGDVVELNEITKFLNGENPRNKVYFCSEEKHYNPWDKPYFIQMDTDFDSIIKLTGGPGGIVESPVAVWTYSDQNEVISSFD